MGFLSNFPINTPLIQWLLTFQSTLTDGSTPVGSGSMDGSGKHRAPDFLERIRRLLVRNRPLGNLHIRKNTLLRIRQSGGEYIFPLKS